MTQIKESNSFKIPVAIATTFLCSQSGHNNMHNLKIVQKTSLTNPTIRLFFVITELVFPCNSTPKL